MLLGFGGADDLFGQLSKLINSHIWMSFKHLDIGIINDFSRFFGYIIRKLVIVMTYP